MQICFQNVFWKYVNPICGNIAQLIQDGLLTNEFLEPFSRIFFWIKFWKLYTKPLKCTRWIRKQKMILNPTLII